MNTSPVTATLDFDPARIERVLVHRLGSLGDTVMALPGFHLVRRVFPRAKITVLTNLPVQSKAPPLENVLGSSGLYDAVIAYPVGIRDVAAIARLRRQIADQKFELVVSLAAARGLFNSARDWCFFRSCGIPRTVGLPFAYADLASPRQPDGSYEWEARRLVRRLAPLGPVELAADEWWDLRLTPGEDAEAARVLQTHRVAQPFLAVSVGTKVDTNDWGEARWNTLVMRLAQHHPHLPLVAFGSREDRARSERLLGCWRGPTANLCGVTAPRVSAAVLRSATLFLGHDSGPMHLAACVGVPCVGIFSARNVAGKWYPRGRHNTILYHPTACAGCHLDWCEHHQKKCLTSITVTEVLDAAQQHLAADNEARPRGHAAGPRPPVQPPVSDLV